MRFNWIAVGVMIGIAIGHIVEGSYLKLIPDAILGLLNLWLALNGERIEKDQIALRVRKDILKSNQTTKAHPYDIYPDAIYPTELEGTKPPYGQWVLTYLDERFGHFEIWHQAAHPETYEKQVDAVRAAEQKQGGLQPTLVRMFSPLVIPAKTAGAVSKPN